MAVAMTGRSRVKRLGKSIRPCMKSPPTRKTYNACADPADGRKQRQQRHAAPAARPQQRRKIQQPLTAKGHEREPEPVRPAKVQEVQQTLSPPRGAALLGDGRVWHQRGEVPHAEHLVGQRQRGGRGTERKDVPRRLAPSGPAATAKSAAAEDREVGPHEGPEPHQERRRPRLLLAARCRLLSESRASARAERPSQAKMSSRLEAGRGEVPERGERDHDESAGGQQRAPSPALI